jgi:uncharacterized protein
MRYRYIFLVLAIVLTPSPAQTAGFVCSRAGNAAERAVCNDSELSGMDDEMTELYRSHLKELPSREAKSLRSTQRAWLTDRNRCEEIIPCLRARYKERIMWLKEFEAYEMPEGKLLTITAMAIDSDNNGCGNRSGGFDAIYRGHRIGIRFSGSVNSELELCVTSDQKLSFLNRYLTIAGKWSGKDDVGIDQFEAKSISLSSQTSR